MLKNTKSPGGAYIARARENFPERKRGKIKYLQNIVEKEVLLLHDSVSSWEASVGKESVIGPTAVAAGFTDDSAFAFSSTAFAVEGGEEVVGSLSASRVHVR
ncbi:hypothetical protein NPIL_350801 [Nephila pilipes]|uniref:Uncharacterized protein n=1 Tax=Nephila pilipes TaxID=299642 RepID=A0A8X6U9V2_NEPPI|nr:hypothetical protein NPIL_350801 [Nephila pilipes]